MSKKKPNVITPFDDKQRFKDLVNEVISDTRIFTHIPDSISLSGVLFTLTLANKIINFTENITMAPELVTSTDFSVKGKIVSR